MLSQPNLAKIRNFINRERAYMLMLCFILLFNAFVLASAKIPFFADERLEKEDVPASTRPEKSPSRQQPLIDEEVLLERLQQQDARVLLLVNLFGLAVLVVFGLGLFLDLHIIVTYLKQKTFFAANKTRLSAGWGIWDIVKLMIIFVFFGYLLNIVEGAIFAHRAEHPRPTVFPMVNTGILDLTILGFVIYFVRVKYRQSLAAFGLRTKGLVRDFLLAMLSYIAFLPILVLILILIVLLAMLFNYHPPQQTVIKVFLQERSAWLLVYSALMVVFLGPLTEEVFFRGFAYNAVKKKLGRKKAMFLIAAIFAGLHANLLGFLPIMALGLLLVYMYEKTGSLISSITIHVLHNGAMVAMLFFGRYLVHLTK